jgi:hypothetical protein
MYTNINSIVQELTPLVGYAPSEQFLNPETTDSITGLQFNDIHPLLQSYDNLKAVLAKDRTLEAQLQDIRVSSARMLVNTFLTSKVAQYNTKSVFEDLTVYEGGANMRDAIVKRNRFVGFEFSFTNFKDLVAVLTRVGLQFTLGQDVLTLYLYHTSSPNAPLATYTVNVAGSGSFRWVALNAVMSWVDDNTNAGGSYILGYKESELTGQALNRDRDISVKPCVTCSTYEVRSWANWSKYIKLHPFSVSESEIGENGELWDLNKNDYDYTKNWGMNFELSVKCDVTETLKRNIHAFKSAYQLHVAVRLLDTMFNTMENNGLALKLQKLAQYALDEKENPNGVRKLLRESVKALDFDLSGLNSLCFPSKEVRKIRNGSV